MVIKEPTLTLTADVDPDTSGDETGVFDFDRGTQPDPMSISAGVEPIEPIGAPGSGALDQITSYFLGGRQDVSLDFGAGRHFVEVSCITRTGDSRTWGDTSVGTLPADGTGAEALAKLDVLKEYIVQGTFDSRGAATLEYGLHGTDEPLDALNVKPEAPQIDWPESGDYDTIRISVRLYDVTSFSDIDAAGNRSVI